MVISMIIQKLNMMEIKLKFVSYALSMENFGKGQIAI